MTPERLLTALINDIEARSRPLVLVLDDYHLVSALPVHQQLAFLLEHRPSQLHLVIASREAPPLPLARLRARGQIVEIRQADLEFTPVEATEFFRCAVRRELSAADMAALHAVRKVGSPDCNWPRSPFPVTATCRSGYAILLAANATSWIT